MPDDCAIEEDRTHADQHFIPDSAGMNNCAWGNINALAQRRLSEQESIQLVFNFAHHCQIEFVWIRFIGLVTAPDLARATAQYCSTLRDAKPEFSTFEFR